MQRNILAPVQKDDGCSFFRIETPAKYLTGWSIDTPQYQINKFRSPHKSGITLFDRVSGSMWDRTKLRERKKMVDSQASYDAFWLSRSLLSFDNSADRRVKDIIYDVDDAIWLNGEANHCFGHHCRESLVVLAGNNFVANEASKYTKLVEIVPTSVDTTYYRNLNIKNDTFNVGWIGSAAGLRYLVSIERQLLSFFEKRPDARLIIVAEREPRELKTLEKYITYMPWSRDTELNSINMFSVGIMPLHNTDWERGKCSFKMLQYMGCGIPSIVSPVGMNVEVMNHGKTIGSFGQEAHENWGDVLELYYNMSEPERNEQGKRGRAVVQQHYSTEVIAKRISSHFHKYL
jgi:glycosyltransferase involved in cell wall biosynthesis